MQVQGGDSSGEDVSAAPEDVSAVPEDVSAPIAAPEVAPAKKGRRGAVVEEIVPEAAPAPAKRGRRGAVEEVQEAPAPSPAKRGRGKKVEEAPAKVASPVKEVRARFLNVMRTTNKKVYCQRRPFDQDH